jgi:hypothetical protein
MAMEYIILKEVSVEGREQTGKTKHYMGDEQLPPAAKLQIVQYPGDEGFYLFYLDSDGEVMTDTYHDTLESALKQANFEYAVKQNEW